MRLMFYAPFKPPGHAHPSGDLTIAESLLGYLTGRGHQVCQAGGQRMRWIYWKPWAWPRVLRQYQRSVRRHRTAPADLWLTYHTYYKAPDLLGPAVCRRTGIPYAVFQGIYSTKRRRRIKTLPGYYLNRRALAAAGHVFSNRHEDWKNLKRLIAPDRLTFIRPGIQPDMFRYDAEGRMAFRRAWGAGETPVVLSAAMFRPGVKTRGIAWVIRSCGRLYRMGIPLLLVVAGDGKERDRLLRLGEAHLPGRVRFVGQIPRQSMRRFYSAGDVFAFPGIRESLGMVYLESQSCGLPVVAFDNGGIPEIMAGGDTGLLTPPFDAGAFDLALARLIMNTELRAGMGAKAAAYVRRCHDADRNYKVMEEILSGMAGERKA